jgi:hypothetical protein
METYKNGVRYGLQLIYHKNGKIKKIETINNKIIKYRIDGSVKIIEYNDPKNKLKKYLWN